mgnify:CR=1 FL=1
MLIIDQIIDNIEWVHGHQKLYSDIKVLIRSEASVLPFIFGL